MDKTQFTNPREYWKPLKRKNDSNIKIRIVKNEDGDIILDEKKIAEIQAKNYKKKFAKKSDIRWEDSFTKWINMDWYNNINNEYNEILTTSITREEFDNILKNKLNNKANGSDLILYELIKVSSDQVKNEIVKLFEEMRIKNQKPQDCQLGLIILLLKPNKDETNIDSYRPICLLNIIQKLFASILTARLQTFLKLNKLLSQAQAGAINERQIQTKLMLNSLVIQDAKEHKNELHMITIDFEGAFTNTNRDNLIHVLNKMKFPKEFIKNIEMIIESNEAAIKVNNNISTKFDIETGTH